MGEGRVKDIRLGASAGRVSRSRGKHHPGSAALRERTKDILWIPGDGRKTASSYNEDFCCSTILSGSSPPGGGHRPLWVPP